MFTDRLGLSMLEIDPVQVEFTRHEELSYIRHARKLMHRAAYKRKQQARKRTGRNRK